MSQRKVVVMRVKKTRWFHPKVKSGWSKVLSQRRRRQLTLKAHHGDLLSAARGKQALANVTSDRVTKELAQKDARYFFQQYRSRR